MRGSAKVVHTVSSKKGKNVCKSFGEKCREIGSMKEICELFEGLKKPTLQTYMNGRTNPPPHISARVDEIHASMTATMERMPGFIADLVARDFPQGIRSEDYE